MSHLNDEVKYQEVGLNYRFFLNWRYGTIVAILVITYFGCKELIDAIADRSPLVWLIATITAILNLLFYMSELRTRELYRLARLSGQKLEDGYGIYTDFSPAKSLSSSKISHSFVINCFGFIGIVSPIAITVLSLCSCCHSASPKSQIEPNKIIMGSTSYQRELDSLKKVVEKISAIHQRNEDYCGSNQSESATIRSANDSLESKIEGSK